MVRARRLSTTLNVSDGGQNDQTLRMPENAFLTTVSVAPPPDSVSGPVYVEIHLSGRPAMFLTRGWIRGAEAVVAGSNPGRFETLDWQGSIALAAPEAGVRPGVTVVAHNDSGAAVNGIHIAVYFHVQ